MENRAEPFAELKKKLQQRKIQQRYRSLKEIDHIQSSRTLTIGEKEFINFSSNDYLNLSNHPHLKEKSQTFIELYGAGSSSSRLITGSLRIHSQLEKRMAALYQKERALLFSTGFQANSTILPSITGKKDVIIADQLCHNSILTGCLASKAKFYRFRHNDLGHLRTFLERKSQDDIQNIWVVTESLFSMDGDRAPLEKIIELISEFNALLYVDDAHAFGVCGKNGLGYGADYPEIDLLVSTFGKAGGSAGAFVATSSIIIEALINYCSGFIYSTAPPPSMIGAIDAALDIIPELDSERNHLEALCGYLHGELKARDFHTSEEPSHILPVIFGDDDFVMTRSNEFKANGLIVSAIRPPTVPANQARFRISLTSAHQKSDCDKLLNNLRL